MDDWFKEILQEQRLGMVNLFGIFPKSAFKDLHQKAKSHESFLLCLASPLKVLQSTVETENKLNQFFSKEYEVECKMT